MSNVRRLPLSCYCISLPSLLVYASGHPSATCRSVRCHQAAGGKLGVLVAIAKSVPLPSAACQVQRRRPWAVGECSCSCSHPLAQVGAGRPWAVGKRPSQDRKPQVRQTPRAIFGSGCPSFGGQRTSCAVATVNLQAEHFIHAPSESASGHCTSLASNVPLPLPLALPQNPWQFIRSALSVPYPNNMYNEPPNPSIEGTLSGLRPPSATHVKR